MKTGDRESATTPNLAGRIFTFSGRPGRFFLFFKVSLETENVDKTRNTQSGRSETWGDRGVRLAMWREHGAATSAIGECSRCALESCTGYTVLTGRSVISKVIIDDRLN